MPCPIMQCRLDLLRLITSGHEHVFAPTTDDVGIYCIIPKIVHGCNIPLEKAIVLFFDSMLLISAAIGLLGIGALYKKGISRLVACIGLAAAMLFGMQVMDVYRAHVAVTIALVPWGLYFMHKNTGSRYLFYAVAGFVIGFAHYIRAHAGTGVLLFLMVLAVTSSTWKKKIGLVITLALGISSGIFFFKTIIDDEKIYLHMKDSFKGHHLWHSVYIGLGFLSNQYGITYDDSIAHKKVISITGQSVEQVYPSSISEDILKQEVCGFVQKHLFFCFQTVAAKIGIILMLFLLLVHIGLYAIYARFQEWKIHVAFGVLICFNALFGVLVIPDWAYLMSFVSCTLLYGAISVAQLTEHE